MFGRPEDLQGSRQPRRVDELNLILYPADRREDGEIEDTQAQRHYDCPGDNMAGLARPSTSRPTHACMLRREPVGFTGVVESPGIGIPLLREGCQSFCDSARWQLLAE